MAAIAVQTGKSESGTNENTGAGLHFELVGEVSLVLLERVLKPLVVAAWCKVE